MKMQILIEGDFYEDQEELKGFFKGVDYSIALHDIRNRLRTQLKYCGRETDASFLETLYDDVIEAIRE